MKLIYLKDIDKSILYQGFTIRTALLNQFIDFFGKLAIGETRKISIMWDNQLFTDIDVINQNFNRERYPNHPEMYQVRYSPNHPFAKAMRLTFPELTQYLEQQQALKKELTQQGGKTHNIRIPDELRCSIVFYATANKDIWEAVPIPTQEINQAKQELITHPIEESLLESLLLNDETAQIIERPHLARIRRIDKNVCLNLKKLYGYRCQICGQLITLPYGGETVN